MKPCKLTMRWGGAPPRPGQWLKSAKGRTAYEITAVRSVARRTRGLGGPVLVLTCARHAPADVPEGAIVHEIRWSPRSRHDFRRKAA